MLVVAGGLQIGVLELLFDITPDLTILQIWIKLNDLNHLLLRWCKLMQVEPASVKCAKYDSPDVE